MKFYLVRFFRSATESTFSEIVELPGWWGTKEISGWLTFEFHDLLESGWEVENFEDIPPDCVEDYQPVRLEGLDDLD